MRKILTGASTILLAATVVVAGGDVWKSKPYSQWDQKDVTAVLQTSPWAKTNVTGSGAWHPADTTPITGGSVGYAGSANDTSHVNGAMANQAGGSEKAAAATSGSQAYNVYWWSSRTIREANLRSQVLKGGITQDAADNALKQTPDDYQVLVAGQNMLVFQQRGEDAFKTAAFLEAKKTKKKIAPTKVEFQKNADGKVVGVVFSFPKKDAGGEPTIAPDEKEVDFDVQVADSWLRTSFIPKQMQDSQGEDL
jgi:hypothetical protein